MNLHKEFYPKYRIKQWICTILGICIAFIITVTFSCHRMEQVNAKVSQTQEQLAKEVFRFHVLANSDSEEDQKVKLQVRDAVLEYMKESMSDKTEGEMSAQKTKEWAQQHLTDLEEVADKVLEKEGYDYLAKAEVTTCYFPDKRYGDVLFPEGWYEALRIRLGEAEGHNWWYVLYPNLCFTNATCAVVSEDGKKELKKALTAEEYEMVTATSDFKIKWFFFGDASEEK